MLDHLEVAHDTETFPQRPEPLEIGTDEREIRPCLSPARMHQCGQTAVDAHDPPGNLREKRSTVSLPATRIQHQLPRAVAPGKMVGRQVAGKVGAKARVIIGQALTGERAAPLSALLPCVLRSHLILV